MCFTSCSGGSSANIQVYCSRPLYHLARSSPLAGRATQKRLCALLRHYGQYRPPGRVSSPLPPAGVHLALLSDRVVERVLSEACFVAPTGPTTTPCASTAEPAEQLQEIDDAALMAALSDRYQPSTAADWHLAIPDSRGVGPAAALIVPGWMRERAAEVLFGDGPEEVPSVSELVLDTLLKVS